jgi:hypothetical protein
VAAFLTHLGHAQLQPLPRQEDAGLGRRQPLQAGFQDLDELRLPQELLGVAPVLGGRGAVTVGEEQFVDQRRALGVAAVEAGVAGLPAQRVDDLVLEYAHHPGRRSGLAPEGLRLL